MIEELVLKEQDIERCVKGIPSEKAPDAETIALMYQAYLAGMRHAFLIAKS